MGRSPSAFGECEEAPSSRTTQNYNHFTGVDYDAKTETNAIFRIQGDGKSWASDVDKENKNFDYLMFVRTLRRDTGWMSV